MSAGDRTISDRFVDAWTTGELGFFWLFGEWLRDGFVLVVSTSISMSWTEPLVAEDGALVVEALVVAVVVTDSLEFGTLIAAEVV